MARFRVTHFLIHKRLFTSVPVKALSYVRFSRARFSRSRNERARTVAFDSAERKVEEISSVSRGGRFSSRARCPLEVEPPRRVTPSDEFTTGNEFIGG